MTKPSRPCPNLKSLVIQDAFHEPLLSHVSISNPCNPPVVRSVRSEEGGENLLAPRSQPDQPPFPPQSHPAARPSSRRVPVPPTRSAGRQGSSPSCPAPRARRARRGPRRSARGSCLRGRGRTARRSRSRRPGRRPTPTACGGGGRWRC